MTKRGVRSSGFRAFLSLMIYSHYDNVPGKHLALGDAKRKNHSFSRFEGLLIQNVRPNERNLFAFRGGNNSRPLPVDLLNDSYHSNRPFFDTRNSARGSPQAGADFLRPYF